MKSFEHDYLLDMPISHQLLSSVRLIGEYRGRQTLYSEQSPEVLDTLKRALFDLRNKKAIRCLGRGPDAEWEKVS
jgi:hypothetical protein